jgi:hypothetical protein
MGRSSRCAIDGRSKPLGKTANESKNRVFDLPTERGEPSHSSRVSTMDAAVTSPTAISEDFSKIYLTYDPGHRGIGKLDRGVVSGEEQKGISGGTT